MESINGLTITLVMIIIFGYKYFKNLIKDLRLDNDRWREAYCEKNTNFIKAEKIIVDLNNQKIMNEEHIKKLEKARTAFIKARKLAE